MAVNNEVGADYCTPLQRWRGREPTESRHRTRLQGTTTLEGAGTSVRRAVSPPPHCHAANMVPEFDTWVPYVRDNVSRQVMGVLLLIGLALGLTFAREQMLSAAFYFGIIVAINAVLWKMEGWTAKRDRTARENRIPTAGWGVDPRYSMMRGWGILDRMRVDEKQASKKE